MVQIVVPWLKSSNVAIQTKVREQYFSGSATFVIDILGNDFVPFPLGRELKASRKLNPKGDLSLLSRQL